MVKTIREVDMELFALALIVIVVIEELRLYWDRKASAKLVKKYQLLMLEHQAVEKQVAKQWASRTSYELGCE